MVNIGRELRRLWSDSAALTATAILMVVALSAFLAAVLIDPREIGGAPAWLKPAKFAVSTGMFCATVAWLFRYLTIWPRFLRLTSWIISGTLIIEVAVIAVQAARGTTSHFNVGTAFDGAMFALMGTCIVLLWVASAALVVALLRQRFEDPAWGWWLRLGMLVTVLGAGAGGLMLGMTAEQRQAVQAGQPVTTVGAHTVGGPDGGPGLPGTGWSTEHGDLRIAHFLGLHGIQMLALLGWLAVRNPSTARRRFAFVGASSYSAVTAILAWQAVRGQPLIAPDDTTVAALAVWLAGTAIATVAARRSAQPPKVLGAAQRMAA